MSESPARPPRTGREILDFVVAGCAIVISLVSLWVAVRANDTQEQLLRSSVWPYVIYDSSDSTENGGQHILLELRNAGVGPAIVRSFAVSYKGRNYATLRELMAACCKIEPKGVLASTVRDSVIMAHDTIQFITVLPDKIDATSYDRILASRFDINVQMCYCSVLGDCWFFDTAKKGQETPEEVRRCPPARQPQYIT